MNGIYNRGGSPQSQKGYIMNQSKKVLAILVVAVILLAVATTGFAYGFFSQRAEIKALNTSLEAAEANISGMKSPSVGTTKNGVVYLSKDAKVYYNSDSAFNGRDLVGKLEAFLPEIAEKKILVFLDGNTIGLKYQSEAIQKSADGKNSVTVYSVAGGLYIVQPTSVGWRSTPKSFPPISTGQLLLVVSVNGH